jgi:succinoglycan biosynthesis protein ExoO
MADRPPDVSFVIPTRNRPRFAFQAIGTALAQESVEVEVIAVDDASTDDTAHSPASATRAFDC